jgi:hypothetical protein
MSRSVIMVLFGKEFDADERAEVGGGDRLGKLNDVLSAATKLLKDRLGVSEDGLTQGLPVVDEQRGDNGVTHNQRVM